MKVNIITLFAPISEEDWEKALVDVEGYLAGECIWFEEESVGNKVKYYKVDAFKGTRKQIAWTRMFDYLNQLVTKKAVENWNVRNGYAKSIR